MARKFKTPITIDELGSASSQALAANVDGDSQNRINIDAGGKITWGSGSATGDTTLYRSAADTLKTDDAFTATSLAVTGQFTFPTSDGSADQVITTNGSGTLTWSDVSANATVSDTAPSSPSTGQIWYESDTGKTFVYYDSYWIEVGASPPASPFITDLDEDTKIQVEESADEDKIRFDTAGSERMIIDASGNVGIGTTSPAEMLDIATASGSAYVRQGNGTATTYLGPDSANTGLFGTSTSHDVRFITGNTERVRIDTSGNVGIGTTSPGAQLQISNTGAGQLYATADGFYVDQSQSQLDTLFLRSQGPVDISSDFDGGTTNDYIRFLTDNSTERMRIHSSGNVGIGTTDPAQTLDVNGKAIVGGGDNLTPDASGNGHLMIDGSGYTGFASLDGSAMWVGHNSGSRSLYLATDETARLTVSGTGLVGIGDTTPTYNLDVNGSEDTASRVNINSGNTANRYLMRFSRNNGLLSNGIYADTGTAYFGTPSDVNLKTGIETISTSDALIALNALRAVDYRYLLDADDVVRKGFIAQEVEEVIPEAVKRVGGGHPTTQLFLDENGDPQYESVDENGDPLIQEEPDIILNWEPITTTLVAAVQELSSLVTTLTARIETLEAG